MAERHCRSACLRCHTRRVRQRRGSGDHCRQADRLDGTRTGDRTLDQLDPPQSRWVLPFRAAGATLEPVTLLPPRLPSKVEVVEIDAPAGFDKPGKYRFRQTLRGDEIFAIPAQLFGVAPADADKMLAIYWRRYTSTIEPSRTTWRFDEPEISAAEAKALNAAIAGFDNNKSYVWEVVTKGADTVQVDATNKFGSFEDFVGPTPPCQSQMKRPSGAAN